MSRNQGIKSKNVTHPSVRTGSGSHSTRPAGTAQIGLMYGTHTTNRRESDFRGERLHNPSRDTQFTPFGNEIAVNTVCKPGGSRNLHGQAGSQRQWGDANPGNPPPNRQRDPLNND